NNNNLNENQRRRLIEHLLSGSTKGKLDKGALKEAASVFSCSRKQVSGVWKRYQQQAADGVLVMDVRQKRLGNSGQRVIDVEKLKEALQQVPLKNRTTQKSVAAQLGIPHSTFKQNMKKLGLRSASRFLKPYLTDTGKARRLAWALRWVREAPGGIRTFDTMNNVVMVDEKWFYKYKQGQKYYLVEGEDLPVHEV
ncbi:unnamed protein product, partial [Laminaria digitata]